MNLEMLKMLADNGEALVLTTREEDGVLWVSRDGGRERKFGRNFEGGTAVLEEALQHHPRDVSIDGRRLETTRAPTSARVMILDPVRHNLEEGIKQEFQPARGTGPEYLTGRCNAIIGGVCCFIGEETSQEEREAGVYLSRSEEGQEGRYSVLRAIQLRPHTVIEAGEIPELAEDQVYGAAIPKRSSLEKKALDRRLRMMEETETLPGMPERHTGEIHFWPLTGQNGDWSFHRGAPVEVTGIPVTIDEDMMDLTPAEFLAVADALTWNRSRLVLVTGEGQMVMGIQVDGAPVRREIKEVRAEAEPEARNLDPAERITLHIAVEDRETLTTDEIELPARLHLRGEWEDDLQGRALTGSIDHEELRDILVRALWTRDDECGWDEAKYQHEMLEERMGHLATHLLGNPVGATLSEMEDRVNRVFMSTPVPDSELSVTSRDGRWTLTLNEAAGLRAA